MSSPLSDPHAWNLVSTGYLEHNLAAFENFAERALQVAGVGQGTRVIDIATGPGSLAVLAAQRGAFVDALDFSAEMLMLAKKRCANLKLSEVRLTEGDGQALPYPDASFDAGFSMFGLMFFPDRGRGFRELRRVLRVGGKAVVSSWRPMNDIRVLSLLFEGIFEAAPDLKPSGPAVPPALNNPEAIVAEMSDAGFTVEVQEIERIERVAFPSLSGPVPARRATAPKSSATTAMAESGTGIVKSPVVISIAETPRPST